MIEKKAISISTVIFSAFAIILVAIISALSISGAWFTDKKDAGGAQTLTFGSISITIQNATLEGNQYNLQLTPTEMLPGESSPTRTLSIKNNGDVSYVRFKPTVKVGENTTMLTLSSVGGNWYKPSGSVYYIYGTSNTPGEVSHNGVVTSTLTFAISNDFGNSFSGQNATIKIEAEAIQVANYNPASWL